MNSYIHTHARPRIRTQSFKLSLFLGKKKNWKAEKKTNAAINVVAFTVRAASAQVRPFFFFCFSFMSERLTLAEGCGDSVQAEGEGGKKRAE